VARFKVIVNPVAGRGAVGRLIPSIKEGLQRVGLTYDLVVTKRPGEAVFLAQAAVSEGYETIVAVGGDGTVNEIANGLMRTGESPPACSLGIIPLGSGNDFIKVLNLPTNIPGACERIAAGSPVTLDLGRVNDRYFVNGVGMGFDAQVAVEAGKIPWLTGLPLYLLAVLRTLLLNYRTPQATIQMDDRTIRQSITMCYVGIGRCAGGGFWLTPDADPADGLFDLAIARGLGRLGILRLLPEVMKGTHVDKEPVTMARTRRLVVDLEEPVSAHADGEIIYRAVQHLEFEVLPQALRVLA